MSASTKKWLKFSLRWGIAVFGIWYVVSNISLHDRVIFLGPNDLPVEAKLAVPAPDDITSATIFKVIDPLTGRTVEMHRAQLVNRADQNHVTLKAGNQRVDLLALDLTDDVKDARVRRLLIKDPTTGHGQWIRPAETTNYVLKVPYPIVDRGIGPMVARANGKYLWAAVFVFPIVYIITAYRWYKLLHAVEIFVTLSRSFVLNMVGAFYNTFMPGSTGGDLLKAYYASKQTKHKTRAVMTVVVDRILGLLALVLMGGTMATYQFAVLEPGDPARAWCGRIAFAALLVMGAAVAVALVGFNPLLRRALGLEFLAAKLPGQKHVLHVVETMRIYRDRPGLILWAIIVTLPVHATVVTSAMFAGMAFNLPMHAMYYWVVVPVVVLSGAMPISPQGAGVMEFFAILLTRRQGVTISGAFALTMSIRVVQMLWNLTGGIFVFRGGYHAPSEAEARDLELDSADAPSDPISPEASQAAGQTSCSEA